MKTIQSPRMARIAAQQRALKAENRLAVVLMFIGALVLFEMALRANGF